MKLSADTLDIVDSITLRLSEAREPYTTGIDAVSTLYNRTGDSGNKGLITLALDSSTMQPLWSSLTIPTGLETSQAVVTGVKPSGEALLTVGSLFQGMYYDPVSSTGFITVHELHSGTLAAAYTVGSGVGVMLQDIAGGEDSMVVAGKWLPGSGQPWLQESSASAEAIEEGGIAVTSITHSSLTQPIKTGEELTGGLDLDDKTGDVETNPVSLESHSLVMLSLKIEELVENPTDVALPTSTETGITIGLPQGTTKTGGETNSQPPEVTTGETAPEASITSSNGGLAMELLEARSSLLLVVIAVLIVFLLAVVVRK
ncbi:hypothetical protein [Aeropyrum camini]|nr:hypothetical protein [Aeropyrum camini]